MPQTFHVLQCYSCSTYQVHQVKKSNKWSCKMCGEKQSVKKVFGEGSGADCRRHVQELNRLRGEICSQQDQHSESCSVTVDTPSSEFDDLHSTLTQDQGEKSSRWSTYVDEQNSESDHEDENDNFTLDRNINKKYRNKRKINLKDPNSFHGDANSFHGMPSHEDPKIFHGLPTHEDPKSFHGLPSHEDPNSFHGLPSHEDPKSFHGLPSHEDPKSFHGIPKSATVNNYHRKSIIEAQSNRKKPRTEYESFGSSDFQDVCQSNHSTSNVNKTTPAEWGGYEDKNGFHGNTNKSECRPFIKKNYRSTEKKMNTEQIKMATSSKWSEFIETVDDETDSSDDGESLTIQKQLTEISEQRVNVNNSGVGYVNTKQSMFAVQKMNSEIETVPCRISEFMDTVGEEMDSGEDGKHLTIEKQLTKLSEQRMNENKSGLGYVNTQKINSKIETVSSRNSEFMSTVNDEIDFSDDGENLYLSIQLSQPMINTNQSRLESVNTKHISTGQKKNGEKIKMATSSKWSDIIDTFDDETDFSEDSQNVSLSIQKKFMTEPSEGIKDQALSIQQQFMTEPVERMKDEASCRIINHDQDYSGDKDRNMTFVHTMPLLEKDKENVEFSCNSTQTESSVKTESACMGNIFSIDDLKDEDFQI